MIKDKAVQNALKLVEEKKFKKVPKKFWGVKDFVKEAAEIDPDVLFKFARNFRDDDEIIYSLVRKNSSSIIYASDRLRDDKKIVLEAVTKDGHVLAYVSDRLKNDDEVVMTAIKSNGFSIITANQRFLEDRKYALVALRQNGFVFKYMENFQEDPEFLMISMLGIVNVDPLNIRDIELKYFDDQNFLNEINNIMDEHIEKICKRVTDNEVLRMKLIRRVSVARKIIEDKKKALEIYKKINTESKYTKTEKEEYVYSFNEEMSFEDEVVKN